MLLQFETLSSRIEPYFWEELGKWKLDELKLNDKPLEIRAVIETCQSNITNLPAFLRFGKFSFESEDYLKKEFQGRPCSVYRGSLVNSNTAEHFRDLDKNVVFARLVDNIWEDIQTGKALEQPCLLYRFLMFTFADLKRFKFSYIMAVPGLSLPKDAQLRRVSTLAEQWPDRYRDIQDIIRKTYSDMDSDMPVFGLRELKTIVRLSDWKSGDLVCFLDPSNKSGIAGWPLRNILLLLKYHYNLDFVGVICYRGEEQSCYMEIELPGDFPTDFVPRKIGWEKNADGKISARNVDMGASMDPAQMAAATANLNLKLMKWRLVPTLDLDIIQRQKVLLLGSGTLGCYVARGLIGWGFSNITFVDNSVVSYSNLTRQPLFKFADVGKPKALVASAALQEISPNLKSRGLQLNIPMPGHAVLDKGEIKRDFDTLLAEMSQHDVIFLLMDSRESRWLPTVLGNALNKIVINIALGFDSFVVMRHGSRNTELSSRLGCFFCNDVVAPTDSLKNRTLDQQCTVTRPGLSPIASGIGVELLVSVLQHPLATQAPSEIIQTVTDETSTPLGAIPHQIRGFLSHFLNIQCTGMAYDKCTACSDKILNKYDEDGFEFIHSVISDPKVLESLTGLQELQSAATEADWDEDQDF